jgi:hypothetical protein
MRARGGAGPARAWGEVWRPCPQLSGPGRTPCHPKSKCEVMDNLTPLELDTPVGGTPVCMYRQRPPGQPRVRYEPAGGAIILCSAGWKLAPIAKGQEGHSPPARSPRRRPLPAFCTPDGSASCLIRTRPAVPAVRIPPFPSASSDHAFDRRARAHRS